MASPVAAVFWFIVLVLAPGIASEAVRRRLPPHRLNLPPSHRMDLRRWRWQDLNTRNYSQPGRRLLRVFGVLHGLQIVGFVVWGFLFIL